MHECPECSGACSCDMEDMWGAAPLDCTHHCPPHFDLDEDDFDDEDELDYPPYGEIAEPESES